MSRLSRLPARPAWNLVISLASLVFLAIPTPAAAEDSAPAPYPMAMESVSATMLPHAPRPVYPQSDFACTDSTFVEKVNNYIKSFAKLHDKQVAVDYLESKEIINLCPQLSACFLVIALDNAQGKKYTSLTDTMIVQRARFCFESPHRWLPEKTLLEIEKINAASTERVIFSPHSVDDCTETKNIKKIYPYIEALHTLNEQLLSIKYLENLSKICDRLAACYMVKTYHTSRGGKLGKMSNDAIDTEIIDAGNKCFVDDSLPDEIKKKYEIEIRDIYVNIYNSKRNNAPVIDNQTECVMPNTAARINGYMKSYNPRKLEERRVVAKYLKDKVMPTCPVLADCFLVTMYDKIFNADENEEMKKAGQHCIQATEGVVTNFTVTDAVKKNLDIIEEQIQAKQKQIKEERKKILRSKLKIAGQVLLPIGISLLVASIPLWAISAARPSISNDCTSPAGVLGDPCVYNHNLGPVYIPGLSLGVAFTVAGAVLYGIGKGK